MAPTVKVITLWRREIENRPGALAGVLQPLATTKADLQVLMAYRFPGDENRGAVELFPVTGKKAIAAASDAGLTRADDIPAVLVQGPNRAGIGYQASRAIAEEGLLSPPLLLQQFHRAVTIRHAVEAVYGGELRSDDLRDEKREVDRFLKLHDEEDDSFNRTRLFS